MRKETLWEAKVRENPGHSQWYIDRFAALRDEGADLHGEARLIDAMAARGSRILDAGCGPGRVGGELARRGHRVVGVDVDPTLVAAAERDHPDGRWLVGDLTELDAVLAAGSPADRAGEPPVADPHGPFDLIVCAGNVMAFLAPGSAPEVLAGFASRLAVDGRAVVAFGAGRGYDFDAFLDDAARASLAVDATYSTWDLRPLAADSDFLVAILSRGPSAEPVEPGSH